MELNTINLDDTNMPSGSQIAKGRAILKQLVATKQLSPEGLKWLTFALDPFHDKEIKGVEGIPDGNTGKTVVCSVVQELTVRKPVTIPAGTNWSCRVATYPVAGYTSLSSGVIFDNIVNNVGAGVNVIAPVVISYAADGTDFPEFGQGSDILDIPATFTKGPFKIGAIGVEVINTTAQIAKQGLVTCARMNQTSCEPFCCQLFNNTLGQYTFCDLFPVRTAPVNLNQMNLLNGTTGWGAEEGAYMVVCLKSMNDKQAKTQPRYPVMMNNDFATGASVGISCAAPNLVLTPIPALGIPGNPPMLHLTGYPGEIPMDTSVAMFSGLSDQTSLTIRVRFMIERFPNDLESEICVLATPTAYYDPIALSIYSQVSQMLPAAVMFRENPQGEWWKRVLGSVADLIGGGLMAAPHPIAKAIGGGLLLANKAFNSDNAPTKAVVENGQYVLKERKMRKKKERKAVARQLGAPPIPPRKKANGYKK